MLHGCMEELLAMAVCKTSHQARADEEQVDKLDFCCRGLDVIDPDQR